MRHLLPMLGDVRHAILIPGGRLSALPWHAAREPGSHGRHALDHVALSYMPNLRSLPGARVGWDQLRRPMTTLAVGQPMPSAMVPLSTDEEIATVRSYDGDALRVARMAGAEATPTSCAVGWPGFRSCTSPATLWPCRTIHWRAR